MVVSALLGVVTAHRKERRLRGQSSLWYKQIPTILLMLLIAMLSALEAMRVDVETSFFSIDG